MISTIKKGKCVTGLGLLGWEAVLLAVLLFYTGWSGKSSLKIEQECRHSEVEACLVCP